MALADMIGHYKRSKFLAEQLACQATATGMSVVIVNPSTPIGPGDVKPTPTGQIVVDAASGRLPHTSIRALISCTSTMLLRGTCWRFIAGEVASATFLAGRT